MKKGQESELPPIPFEFAAFEPPLPHHPILADPLGERAEIAGWSVPLLGLVKYKGQEAPEQQ